MLPSAPPPYRISVLTKFWVYSLHSPLTKRAGRDWDGVEISRKSISYNVWKSLERKSPLTLYSNTTLYMRVCCYKFLPNFVKAHQSSRTPSSCFGAGRIFVKGQNTIVTSVRIIWHGFSVVTNRCCIPFWLKCVALNIFGFCARLSKLKFIIR